MKGRDLTAEELQERVRERLGKGPGTPDQLRDALLDRMSSRYGRESLKFVAEAHGELYDAAGDTIPDDPSAFETGSFAWFAWWINHLDTKARAAIAAGDADGAAYFAFQLANVHWEATTVLLRQPYTKRGMKLVRGAVEGGTARWRKQGWKDRAGELQAAIDRKHAARPVLSYRRLREIVAEDFGCSAETVKRYTKNPKK